MRVGRSVGRSVGDADVVGQPLPAKLEDFSSAGVVLCGHVDVDSDDEGDAQVGRLSSALVVVVVIIVIIIVFVGADARGSCRTR